MTPPTIARVVREHVASSPGMVVGVVPRLWSLVLGGIGTAQLASAQYGGDSDPAPAESPAEGSCG